LTWAAFSWDFFSRAFFLSYFFFVLTFEFFFICFNIFEESLGQKSLFVFVGEYS